MGARLLEERERACDEHVLEILNQPVAYAEAIVEVCKLYIESPLAFVSGVTASNVNKRMEHIVNHRIGAKLDVPKGSPRARSGSGTWRPHLRRHDDCAPSCPDAKARNIRPL